MKYDSIWNVKSPIDVIIAPNDIANTHIPILISNFCFFNIKDDKRNVNAGVQR